MIKKILITLLAISSPLVADEIGKGYTARLFAGFNDISMSFHPSTKVKVKPGQVAGAAVGYKFNEQLHAEVEGSYRFNEVDKIEIAGRRKQFIVPINGDIKSFSLVGNVLYDLPFKKYVQPYIGVGMGGTAEYADWSVNIIEDSVWLDYEGGNRAALSYQLIAGIHLPQTKNFTCGVEFRVLDSVLDHMCNHNKSVIFTYKKLF